MNTHEPDHDPTADLLERALRDEAADVHPAPGALQTIQRRTASTRTPASRPRWIWAAGAASLATAAIVTGVVLVGDDSGGGRTDAPIVDQPEEGQVTAVYPVWFFGAQPGNPEGPGPGEPDVFAPLYVEQHIEIPTGGSIAEQAVRTFLTDGAFDPDYSTGWPDGVDVESVRRDGAVTTIALTGTTDLADARDLNAGQANSAIQAMLRTAGATDQAAFTYNGDQLETLFGLPVAPTVEVLPDTDMDALRAPIQIVELNDGMTLDEPMTVTVSANVFEGTVNWELLDDSGTVVDDGFVTAGAMEWRQVKVRLGALDPGTYTFRAFEVSMADGDETFVDDKTFTVE